MLNYICSGTIHSFMICRFILIIGFLLLQLNNSYGQRVFSDETLKNYLPKKEKRFTLSKKPFVLKDTNVVSLNAIYSRKLTEVDNNVIESVELYNFIKFFPDGRVFFSFPYISFPTRKEIDDFTYGKFGRYVVNGEKIKIEFFMNKQDGIMFLYANPTFPGLQFYKTTGSGFLGKNLKVNMIKEDYSKEYR
jgi:hypothetical protein